MYLYNMINLSNILNNLIYSRSDIYCNICEEKINSSCITCTRCKIKLHDNCEEKYRGENNFTKCPNCLKTGTLGKPCTI